MVQWQGNIGPDAGNLTEATANNEVVITFRVTVDNAVNQVFNQGLGRVDVDIDGDFDEEVILGTSFVISNQVVWSRSVTGGGGSPPITVDLPEQLPATGFSPNKITLLPEQQEYMKYKATDIWMEIPSLGISLPIVGVPLVDGDWNVSWLGNQAGWLNGTAFPSWMGNSVLTSHVTLSNGMSGPFANIENLSWGDKIIIHLYSETYIYQVRENKVVKPDDQSALKHEEEAWLTLITCKNYHEITGAYTNRIVVRAVLVNMYQESEKIIINRAR